MVLLPVLVGAVVGWIIVTNWWFIWAEFPAEALDPAVASSDVQWDVVGEHAAWVAGPFTVVFVGAIIVRAVRTGWRERYQSDG